MHINSESVVKPEGVGISAAKTTYCIHCIAMAMNVKVVTSWLAAKQSNQWPLQ